MSVFNFNWSTFCKPVFKILTSIILQDTLIVQNLASDPNESAH